MDLKQVKPKLRDCVSHNNGAKLVLEQNSTRKQLVLPLDRIRIIDLLNGENTIEEIIAKLYESKAFKFRTVLTLLELLQEEGFIEPLPVKIQLGDRVKALHDSKATFLERGLVEISLGKSWSWPIKSDYLFFVTALAGLVLGGYAAVYAFLNLDPSFFLRSNDEYLYAIPTLFVICSILMTFKNLARLKLLGFLTGVAYRPTISFSGFSLYFSVSNNSLYLSNNRRAIIIYSLSSIFLYLAPITILLWLFPGFSFLNDAFLVAALLTLLDLNPYRKSEFTRLLHLLFSEEVQGRMVSYLRNRSLLSLSPVRTSIQDEGKYFVYSIFALIWTVGFLLLVMDYVLVNFPNLYLGVIASVTGIASQVQSGIVLFLLIGLVLYLGLDLLRTVALNIFFPFASSFYRMQRNGGAKASGFSEQQVKNIVAQIPFFQRVSDNTIDFLVSNGETKAVNSGKHVIVQGDVSQEVFVLLSGSVRVVHREESGLSRLLAVLKAPAIFGEMAILNRTPRSADVVAGSDISVLRIPNAVFEAMLQSPDLENDHALILRQIHVSRALSQTPLLRRVAPETIGLIASRTEIIGVEAGVELIREGEKDRSFYILLDGTVVVERDGKKVSEIGKGAFFGEVALVSRSPRIATVRSTSSCQLAKLEAEAFWDLLLGDLNLAAAIEAVAEERLDDQLC